MSLARVKTWIAETLYYSDLNAEFDNILNNPTSLVAGISPTFANLTTTGTISSTGKITATAAGIDVATSALGTCYSSTYTPTRAVDGNISGGTTRLAQYSRVGNLVTVAGQLQVDTSGAGASNFTLTLPVASNLANTFELGGSATAYVTSTTQYPVHIQGHVSGNTADFYFNAAGAATYIISYTYSYLVI